MLIVCFYDKISLYTSAVFFFSSRRRHTRCYRDWSSDVCSSDLTEGSFSGAFAAAGLRARLAGGLALPGAVPAGIGWSDRLPVRVGDPAQLPGQAGRHARRVGRPAELPGLALRARS